MPLPTVEGIKEIEELEALIREYTKDLASVTMLEISNECVLIRPCKEDISAVYRCLRAVGLKTFDPVSNRYIRYDGTIDEIQRKLRLFLRERVREAIKAKRKDNKYIEELGCTIIEFRRWIQGQFEEGMTWGNYGEWEVDHKRRLSLFDLRDRKQYLAASHWRNLRPLWADQHHHRPRVRHLSSQR